MKDHSHLEIWEAYSASWSEPDETIRKEILSEQLSPDCNYKDPDVDISGIENLSDYMEEFQKGLPGAKFVITDFKVHHDQSLTHWNMVDSHGNTLSQGASFGMYRNGQLIKMTGFF
ncbi:hypothetical protein GVN16_21285 [Emticicia sp. CRIBPO]|uniref:nuclear transport factor 2 family protein n=1 Tax=Emticicia sp. CRIBPO TaxID=2683258 RepID=UPI0014137218|nr:nuclear transport factor 2 family protein [Emticicia sp. CRIBPO]NBA88320.1 hypothetical protein [Emticicia sp. CRIBPO]